PYTTLFRSSFSASIVTGPFGYGLFSEQTSLSIHPRTCEQYHGSQPIAGSQRLTDDPPEYVVTIIRTEGLAAVGADDEPGPFERGKNARLVYRHADVISRVLNGTEPI